MTNKELIRRALMGDKQAQQECTEKGILLPCPFCGSDSKAFTCNDLFGVRCVDSTCVGHDMSAEYYLKSRAIEDWNTRPAPPVGRCKDCRFCEGMSKNQALHCSLNSFGIEYGLTFITPESFCSCFEPKED